MEDFNDKSGHRARLRSKFLGGGLSSLAEYEVLELLLTFCIPRKDVKPIAKSLLARHKNLKEILNADPADIATTPGMGDASACLIKFIRELIPLYHLQTLENASIELDTIDKLIEFFRARLDGETKEVMEMACFDPNLYLIPNGSLRLSEGSVSYVRTDFRKIVEFAIKKGASSIVIAHNHPFGLHEPSNDDIMFTRKLSQACCAINLNFIEHLIIAKGGTFSFRRDGRFDDLYDITVPAIEAYEGNVAAPLRRLKM